MTDERQALREALDFIADWAHDCISAEDTAAGYGFADIEKMARAALALAQVPESGWRIAMCPHCGEELSVPAQEEGLDVERLNVAIGIRAGDRRKSALIRPRRGGYRDLAYDIAAEYRALSPSNTSDSPQR